MGDARFRPCITIKSHDLHVGDIKGAMGEITSYHKKDKFSLFFWFLRLNIFCLFLWLSFFASPMMAPTIDLLLDLTIDFLLDFCTNIFFTTPTYTCTIISLEPCALNDEFHSISKFNKIYLLCEYH